MHKSHCHCSWNRSPLCSDNFFCPWNMAPERAHFAKSNPTAKNMGEHSWIGLCLMNLKPYCAHKVQTSLAYSAEKNESGSFLDTPFLCLGYYIKALGTAAQIQKCVDTWKKFFNSNRLFAVVARNPSGTTSEFTMFYACQFYVWGYIPGSWFPQFTRTHYGCFQE